MSMWFQIAMLLPVALQSKGNLLACALGHDQLPGQTFSVPVSSDGSEPITHYTVVSPVQQSFIDMLVGAKSGILPDIPWEDFGLSEEDVLEVISNLQVSEPSEDRLNLDEWLDSLDLKRINN